MVGINRIWRIGDAETDGSITNPNNEIVEFDDVTLVQPGTGNAQFTTSARVNVTVDITQLSALKGDINPSQDGGVGGVRFFLIGTIRGLPAQDGRKRLLDWLLNEKTTTDFPHGRFGTQFDKFSEFNVTPDGDLVTGFGWLVEDLELIRDEEWEQKTSFTMTLKYNGSKTGITANLT
jgi:hypothetical protein